LVRVIASCPARHFETTQEICSMKHIRQVSVARTVKADALSDLYNSIWQAWLDFVYTKKNQIVTPVTS
jgi:hypothetical protein